jgi:membrane-bound ClpP family serine protease
MKHLLAVLTSTLVGLAFLVGGVALVIAEYRVPPVHTTHLFAGMALAILGALMLPAIGSMVEQAGRRGIGLAALGRRAYDGKLEAEEPKP